MVRLVVTPPNLTYEDEIAVTGVSRGNRQSNYWRGHVMYRTESSHLRDGDGASLVVLYDYTTQGETGADLLTLHFTHDDQLG